MFPLPARIDARPRTRRQGPERGGQIDRELINDLLDTMEQTSLCALGGGVPLPIKNALKYFADELQAYFQD